MRVGVEVGGTFTDLVAVDGDEVRIAKVPSVPARPDEGTFAAIEAAGLSPDRMDDLVHGSTVSTNAILERKGARIAFLVTAGFRDILLLQRQSRMSIYDLAYAKARPVVARRDSFEVEERIAADGLVVVPLDRDATAVQIETWLGEGDYQAVAICLLNGYANPAHEEALAGLVHQRFPDLPVTCSSDVTREFREYERASTTTLSAYVQPVLDAYLTRIERHLEAQQFHGHFSVMQSNGGRLPPEGMRRNPIGSLFSGPAAGVIGAVKCAARSGHGDLISIDMGGTSTDVCLIENGTPEMSTETEIDGLPVRTPVLDIATVGAGGGSIVWIDDGGMLRVGPQSAGAEPGPACYDRGGSEPTITDAHIIRGTIQPESFLGGDMALDPSAARAAFEPLAARFAMSLEEIADSAVRIASSNIVRAIQLISTQRGRDPRDYVLVPFGGAGPLHAAQVADDLGISTILVPPNAGVISAYGLLTADYVHHASETRRLTVDAAAADEVRRIFDGIKAREAEGLAALGLSGKLVHGYVLGMRYVGQAYEVPVSFTEDDIGTLTAEAMMDRFAAGHRQVFNFGDTGTARAEVVNFRLSISAPLDALPRFTEIGGLAVSPRDVTILDAGEARSYRLMARASLAAGDRVAGPALVEETTSTILVPDGWQAETDAHDNLVIGRDATKGRTS